MAANRRWCWFCGVRVPPGPGLAQCDACREDNALQIDEMLRKAAKAWAPPPKDDGQEGGHDH